MNKIGKFRVFFPRDIKRVCDVTKTLHFICFFLSVYYLLTFYLFLYNTTEIGKLIKKNKTKLIHMVNKNSFQLVNILFNDKLEKNILTYYLVKKKGFFFILY